MYKVLTMVLANRLRAVITIVVSDSQSTFVKGKQILDGILFANEVVDEACQLKIKRNALVQSGFRKGLRLDGLALSIYCYVKNEFSYYLAEVDIGMCWSSHNLCFGE